MPISVNPGSTPQDVQLPALAAGTSATPSAYDATAPAAAQAPNAANAASTSSPAAKPITFTFTSPSGTKYTVNGPAGSTTQQAWGVLQQHLANLRQIDQQAAQSVVNQMPAAQRFVVGAGEALTNLGRGATELAEKWGNKLGLVSSKTLAAEQQQLQQDATIDKPLMSTTSGMLGGLAADTAVGGLAPEGMLGAVGAGAALGGFQPTTGSGSQLDNAVMGGALGGAGEVAGRALGRLMQPVRNVLSDSAASDVQVLKDAGVPLNAAQSTGSRVAQDIANAAGPTRMLGKSGFQIGQQKAFTRAVLNTIGVADADLKGATPGVMNAAARRIGGVLDDIADRNPIKVDAPLLDTLAQIHTAADQEMVPTEAGPIKAQIDNVISRAAANDGKLTGAQFQEIRSSLGRLAANTTNGSLQHAADGIRVALGDALERQVAPEDAAALSNARNQWRRLRQIEGAVGPDNQVAPGALWNRIDSLRNSNQTVFGRGDQVLVQLAQAGKNILGNAATKGGLVKDFIGYEAGRTLGDHYGDHPVMGGLAGLAAAEGLTPLAARTVVESAAGRAWLERIANSRALAATATGIRTASPALGAGLAGSILAPSGAPIGPGAQ